MGEAIFYYFTCLNRVQYHFMASEKDEETDRGVLSSRYAGGPHGLGDPDDKTLRKVEREVLVPKVMRRLAQTELCFKEMKAFHECCEREQLMMGFKCKPENKNMQDCLIGWFKNEEFRQKCTEIYLEERSEYRRTGLTKKVRKFIQLRDEGKIKM